MAHKILEEAQEMNDLLIKWRRDLHQIPETDLEFPKTVEYISKRLDEMNVEYKVFPEVSVIIAQIGKGDKCFLLRNDMDALPVEEETGLEFASKNGCMHGCGHDLHATILLGAAKILKAYEEELPGVVKLLFQPGEETFRGAKAAVEAGVLENPHVDVAFAAHVFAAIPYGTIGYGVEAMASVYGFKITLTGRGGHGSAPEGCIDPINAGVEVYYALQALIARECPPSAEVAITIGQFTAGNVANVIPERCVLQGALRTFNEEVRTMLIRRINEIVPAVAAAYRTTCEIEELSNVPSVTCNEELNAEYIKSVESLENPGTTINCGFHVMGSEDFAVISAKIPASYFVVGAGVEDQSKWKGQHNPKILFNEKALPLGAAMYAKIAMDWLAK